MNSLFYKSVYLFIFVFALNVAAFGQTERDRGIELYGQGKYAEAIRVLQPLSKAKDTKKDAMVWNYLGLAYMDDGDLKQARKALEKAVDLNAQSAAFRINLAYVLLLSRKIDGAQQEIDRALQLDPQSASAYYLRGTARVWERKFSDAPSDADKIIAIDPNFSNAYTLKSNAYVFLFGEKVNEDADEKNEKAEFNYLEKAKAEIVHLEKSIEALEYCVKNCKDNKSLGIQTEKLEALKAFHRYFMRDTTTNTGNPAPTEEITPLKVISKKPARYTDNARKSGIQGTITLAVLFAANAQVQHILVLKGLGHGLEEQAISAARQIKFEPMRVKGVPTSVVKLVSYSFTIY